MLSMVNWCLTEQPEREIWLFYGVRHGRELVMQAHLETLATAHPNFHLRLCFSNPLPESSADSAFNTTAELMLSCCARIAPQALSLLYLRPDANAGKSGAWS